MIFFGWWLQGRGSPDCPAAISQRTDLRRRAAPHRWKAALPLSRPSEVANWAGRLYPRKPRARTMLQAVSVSLSEPQ